MLEKIKDQIEKLDRVGQQSFNETDYSFGFNTWKSGTLILLNELYPSKKDLIERIDNIFVKRINTLWIDSRAYNINACKQEAKEILQIFLESQSFEIESNNDFWDLLHPEVKRLSKERFDNSFYADAILTCLREINTIVKNYVRENIGQELDGAPLMTRAFSVNNPIIAFADISTENGRNIQQGYMKIFEGSIVGIRNPKSHANLNPDKNLAIHFLFLASFMFTKLKDAGVITV